MAENFVDNIAYGQSALSISGDALVIGATNTNATSKSIFFNNNSTSGQLVWGPSANRTISLPDANGVVMLTSQGVLSLSAGTTQLTSGQVVFSNSNGVSFGVNGQTVTGSIATSLTNVNFSAGTTSNNLSAITFSNSNGISFGLNGSTLTGSVATSLTNVNFSAGTTSNNLSAITFSNSNGISFGLNGSTLTGSVATSLTNVNFSAGTTSNNLSAVTFSNANGVSFGLNGSTITASVAAGAVNFSAGTTSNNLNSITFSNSNGISFGLNGSTLTGSVATSLTGVNLSAGTTSNNLSAFVFSNSNNVSFGLNGSTVTASATIATSLTNINLSAGTASNNLSAFVFSNSNGMSFGLNGSTVTGSYTVPSTAGLLSAINVSAGTTSSNIGAITFSNANNVSFGFDGTNVTGSIATSLTGVNLSAGTTSNNLSAFVFSNSNNVSFGLNGSTVTASYSGPNINNFEPQALYVSNSSSILPGVGSWYFEPFYLPANISGGRINKLVSFAGTASLLVGSSASFNSGSTGTRSNAYNFNRSVAIYGLDAGTNSTRLASIWSNTFTIGLAQSVSVSLNGGTALTVSNGATISYIASIDSAGAYTTSSFASSTAISTAATTMAASTVTVGISSILNMLSGQMVIPVGFNTTLTPGNYWMAHAYSTASTTGGTSIVAGSQLSLVNFVGLQAGATSAYRIWGQINSTSASVPYPGIGVYSAASASPMATVAFSNIRNVAAIRQYFNIVNSTI